MPNEDQAYLDFYKAAFAAVTEFRKVFQLPIGKPLSEQDEALHLSLLVSELQELTVAKSKVAQADAIIDSLYVYFGRAVQAGVYHPGTEKNFSYPIKVLYELSQTMGFPTLDLFHEVHQSNLSKRVETIEQANAEKEVLTSKGLDVEIIKTHGGYIFKSLRENRDLGIPEGKVLKPTTTTKPNISKHLNK